MADTPKHSVSVAGIVVDEEDRVLVIQRRDNAHWEPPGGILELGESPEDGARREVFEETGVSVAVDELSGVYKNMTRGIIALVFRCRRVGGDLATTDESIAVAWHSVADVIEQMDPAFAVRVTDAFEPDVRVRVHDGTRLLDDDSGRSPRPEPRATSGEEGLPAGHLQQ